MTSEPYSAVDLAAGALTAAVLLLGVRFLLARTDEVRLFVLAFAAKLVCSLALGYISLIYYAGSNDMVGYYEEGLVYSNLLRDDLLWGIAGDPFFGIDGSSTTRMNALSGSIQFLLFNSFLAASFVFATIGFVGQLLLFRAFRARFPAPELRAWWAFGFLFFPSLTFWSAGMVKEAVALLGIGAALWGCHCLLEGHRLRGAAFVLFGGYTLLLFRNHVLPVLLIALAVWVLGETFGRSSRARLSERSERSERSRLATAMIGLAAMGGTVAGLWLVGQLEPRLSFAYLPIWLTERRDVYESGTLVTFEASWSSLAASAPAAALTTLFRPFLWEASGVAMIMAAAENFLLVVLVARTALRTLRRRQTLVSAARMPLFVACCVFVMLFAVATGASTPNLGTLSRYRTPLMPFLLGALVILEWELQAGRHKPDGIDRRSADRPADVAPRTTCFPSP